MQLNVVGHTAEAVLRVLGDLISKLTGDQSSLWFERLKLMLQEQNPFAELATAGKDGAGARDWRAQLVATVRTKLRPFSTGWAKQVTPPPAEWTEEFLANAAKLNMKPVFFPVVTLDEKFSRRKYTKPGQWVYDQIAAGSVDRGVLTLKSGWALADFSIGTDYTDGSQVFPNDPWAALITRLRSELKVVGAYHNTPMGSRFSITHNEWIDVVLARMASALHVSRAKVSLERMADFSFIGNVYDHNRGKFNAWEWFEDLFGRSGRLFGGRRDRGGLSRVGCDLRGGRDGLVTARPLVRFVQ